MQQDWAIANNNNTIHGSVAATHIQWGFSSIETIYQLVARQKILAWYIAQCSVWQSYWDIDLLYVGCLVNSKTVHSYFLFWLQ